MRWHIALLTVLTWLVAPGAQAIDEKKLVDLTYPFEESTLHWPTAKGFNIEKVNEGFTPQGFWYASYNYSASEHAGTHLDAPFHFAHGQWTTDQIPLARLIGTAVVIDVGKKAGNDPLYRLEVADIRAWEKRYGRIPDGAIVLMRSGWGRYWGDRKKYFGADEPGDVTNLRFPGFSGQAAEFLAKERKIDAAGVDTASIDYGASRDFVVHRIFGAANVPVFENVAFLERLPAKGATIFAIPMKIKGGTGGPLRIFALLP